LSDHILLIYIFVCLAIGLSSFGFTFISAKQNDPLAKSYLVFYAVYTFNVCTALLLAYSESIEQGQSSLLKDSFQYLESFIGRYGLMFAWPLFVHRMVGIGFGRRDKVILAIVMVTFVSQHFTEFWMGDIWDDRGDIFEDLVSTGIVLYTLWIGATAPNRNQFFKASRLLWVLTIVIVISEIGYEFFFSGESSFRFYPLWYCIISVVFSVIFIKRNQVPEKQVIPSDWGLSPREIDVLKLVQQGLGNKIIAKNLDISLNTIKTHLRSIFDKSGIRSRVGLIAYQPPSSEKPE
jgi:DNA-binding CsgD family transcriptional regulator